MFFFFVARNRGRIPFIEGATMYKIPLDFDSEHTRSIGSHYPGCSK
jgi:hypothetical protein